MTKTETVKVPVEVVKPLPETLTRPLAYPPALPQGFTVEDLWDRTFALYDLLDQANEDRRRAAQLTQPSEGPAEDDVSLP